MVLGRGVENPSAGLAPEAAGRPYGGGSKGDAGGPFVSEFQCHGWSFKAELIHQAGRNLRKHTFHIPCRITEDLCFAAGADGDSLSACQFLAVLSGTLAHWHALAAVLVVEFPAFSGALETDARGHLSHESGPSRAT